MSGIAIKVEIKGDVEVVARLEGDTQRMRDLTPAMRSARNVMDASIQQNFQRSGRPVRWAPLSPKYLRRKLRQGYGPQTLVKTGLMRRSVTSVAGSDNLKIGTAVHYARHHHFGTRKMPKRRFLLFQKQDVRDINRLVMEHIFQRRSGRG